MNYRPRFLCRSTAIPRPRRSGHLPLDPSPGRTHVPVSDPVRRTDIRRHDNPCIKKNIFMEFNKRFTFFFLYESNYFLKKRR